MRRIVVIVYIVIFFALPGCASIEAYKARENKDLRNAETHVQLGIGYFRQGKLDIALEKLKKALEAKSDYAPAHSAIAIVYEQLQEYDKANDHYVEAISLAPEDGGLYNNYGVFLCKQQRYLEAEKYFLKAINTPRYETPELAYENAGACVRKIPDIKKSESYLKKALNRNPKLPVSLINMAEIRFEQQNYLSSRGFLQRFEEVSPHNAASLWLGILIERRLGDKKAESNYAKQLQSKFPKSEQFKLLLNSQGEHPS